MSKILNDLFGIEHSIIECSPYDPLEKIAGGWNDSIEFKTAVSEGMIEMWNTDYGLSRRKLASLNQRQEPEKYISAGHKGMCHSGDMRKKIGAARLGKKLSEDDKQYIKCNYLNGMGVKVIAKNLGFSATGIRKHIKTRNIT